MRDFSKKIILAGITFSAFLSTTTLACVVPATVTYIHDGDSFKVVDTAKQEYLIRLLAADSPQPGQPHSNEAKQHLEALIADQVVCIEPIETDTSERVIARIKLKDQDIGLSMIRAGYAWYDTFYKDQQTATDQTLYSEAELQASIEAIGLWSHTSPIPPWDWTLPPQ